MADFFYRLAEDGRYVGLIVTKSKSENSGRTKSFSIKYPPFFDNMVNKIVSVGYSYTPADYCVIDETSVRMCIKFADRR